jgi:hypothetical protein
LLITKEGALGNNLAIKIKIIRPPALFSGRGHGDLS